MFDIHALDQEMGMGDIRQFQPNVPCSDFISTLNLSLRYLIRSRNTVLIIFLSSETVH